MEIKKKCWPDEFNLIESGKKKFDLRLADQEYNEGDILVLEEFNPEIQEYTGRKLEKKITFVLKTKNIKYWTPEEIQEKGLVVVSLE
jgi:hypothetical protein